MFGKDMSIENNDITEINYFRPTYHCMILHWEIASSHVIALKVVSHPPSQIRIKKKMEDKRLYHLKKLS